ncbi:N-acetylglucosaminidase [Salinicoccus albus]|uniref:N-acetylglucosaminidase n=1 Tax=Salinicoccus albus TaxID=418756 RepID=UPI000363AB1F|nr:N-acetylglucosaminidase [Salinicoccus albus]
MNFIKKQDYPVLLLLGLMVVFFITFLVAETTLMEDEQNTHTFEAAVETQQNTGTEDLRVQNESAVPAEDEEIRNAMDISRNSTDYQFLRLDETVDLSAEELNQTLEGRGILEGQGETFLNAQEQHGLNALYLISHAQVETGNGESELAQGIEVEGTTYYNFFGIGAFDQQAVSEGSSYAARSDWTSPEAAIMQGAQFISNNYVGAGQDTLYAMRWNPENPGQHLYATDIEWALKIGNILEAHYDSHGISGDHFDKDYYQ